MTRPNPPTPLIISAVRWWESHRPLTWSLDHHLNHPLVNLVAATDKDLANDVADYIKGNLS
jgi:hypothetical protein